MLSATSNFVLLLILSFFVNGVFLQESDQPDVKPKYLTKDEFDNLMNSDQRFIVNFVSPGCVKCSEFAPEYDEIARHFATEKSDLEIKVFIEGDLQVIRRQGLRRLPSLYYVRERTPLLYTGDMNAHAVIQWVELTGRKIHRTLTDENFEHLSQAATGHTTGDWLVLFCDVNHSDCTILLPMWESIAYRLHSRTNVAVVDTPNNPKLVKRFKLPSVPTMHLFRQGKRYLYPLQQREDSAILGFADNGYKQYSGAPVEVEPSPFDTLTENIADQLKEALPEGGSSKVLVIVVPIAILVVIVLCVTRRRGSKGLPERTKKGV